MTAEALEIMILNNHPVTLTFYPTSEYANLECNRVLATVADEHYWLTVNGEKVNFFQLQSHVFQNGEELAFILEQDHKKLNLPRSFLKRISSLIEHGWQQVIKCPLKPCESSPCGSFMINYLGNGLTDFQINPLIAGIQLFYHGSKLDKDTPGSLFEQEIINSLSVGDTLRITYAEQNIGNHTRAYLCLGERLFLGWNPMLESFHIYDISHIYHSLGWYFEFVDDVLALRIPSNKQMNQLEEEDCSDNFLEFKIDLFGLFEKMEKNQTGVSDSFQYIVDPGLVNPESSVSLFLEERREGIVDEWPTNRCNNPSYIN